MLVESQIYTTRDIWLFSQNLYKPLDDCNLKEFSNITSIVNLLEPSHDYSFIIWLGNAKRAC